jgi:hypothetical protein
MPSTMEHVAALSVTIGPRGSTTEAERAAADYAAEVFRALGLTPCVEPFVSATSAWRPYAIATGGMLLMVPLFFLGGRWIAALGTFLLILCTVLELTFTPNPLRLLVPKGRSQNVYAILPPAGPVRQRVILCGHLDTHRTPWAFSSPRALALYRTLVTLGLPGAAGMGVLFGIGAWTGDPRWGWPALLPALLLAAVFAMAVQADLTPYTHGANDNATGAGMVLALAERLRREPLRHTEVWALCTGCEEVGAYGAAAFVRRHRDLGRPIFIVLDTVGGPRERAVRPGSGDYAGSPSQRSGVAGPGGGGGPVVPGAGCLSMAELSGGLHGRRPGRPGRVAGAHPGEPAAGWGAPPLAPAFGRV